MSEEKWVTLLPGNAVFANGSGSMFVDPGGTLTVFGYDGFGRHVKLVMSLPSSVRIQVETERYQERGFTAPHPPLGREKA